MNLFHKIGLAVAASAALFAACSSDDDPFFARENDYLTFDCNEQTVEPPMRRRVEHRLRRQRRLDRRHARQRRRQRRIGLHYGRRGLQPGRRAHGYDLYRFRRTRLSYPYHAGCLRLRLRSTLVGGHAGAGCRERFHADPRLCERQRRRIRCSELPDDGRFGGTRGGRLYVR